MVSDFDQRKLIANVRFTEYLVLPKFFNQVCDGCNRIHLIAAFHCVNIIIAFLPYGMNRIRLCFIRQRFFFNHIAETMFFKGICIQDLITTACIFG